MKIINNWIKRLLAPLVREVIQEDQRKITENVDQQVLKVLHQVFLDGN